MVGVVHRYSGGLSIACKRTQFSGLRSGTPDESGTKVKQAQFFSHIPKDRNCEVCGRTKMTRSPCRRRTGEAPPRAAKFGDLIAVDHKVLNEGCKSRDNHGFAVVVQILPVQWTQSYACKTTEMFVKFLGAVTQAKSHLH